MTSKDLFSKENHLIYILITDKCNVGCDFCMCKHKRKNDELNIKGKTKENIERLISKAYKIGISGQGEPLLNQKAIFDILNIKGSNRSFGIISSANIPEKELILFLKKIKKIIKKNNDTCKIRISLDRFHLPKLKYHNFIPLIKFFIKENKEKSPLKISFRSITTDKKYVKNYISKKLDNENINFVWKDIDSLKSEVIINNFIFEVEYQNIIGLPNEKTKDIFSIEEYITLLERKLKRKFTLGNIFIKGKPGLDITINPNGEVLFYGLECEKIGNLKYDHITYQKVSNFIKNNPFYSTFIKIPLKDIIKELKKDKELASLINNVNNPYWIVRNLYENYKDKLIKNIKLIGEKYD